MANVEHSTLTTTNLHENKGVSAATDNTVATAVTGATVWAKLTASNLTGTGNSFGAQLFQTQDQKATGTGGGSFSSSAWRTRVLNTTLTNEIGASVASNQITLPAGTYYAEAYGVGYTVGTHKVRLYNITDGTTTIVGSSAKSDANSFCNTESRLSGRFTIAGSKVFELQHYCQTSVGNGFGFPSSTGEVEVYANVRIWKVL